MADNKQQLPGPYSAPLLGGQSSIPQQPAGGGGGQAHPADTQLRMPADDHYHSLPASDDPNAPKPYNVIAAVGFLALIVFALSIAALESTWYIGRLNTTPGSTCTASCVTTTQTYELSIGTVKLTTSASVSYKDYNQLVLPKTGSVVSAIRAACICTLVAGLLLALLATIAYVDEFRRSVTGSDLGCYIYAHAPRWLSALALLFTVLAILLPLAFTHTFPDDDIMRQTTNGSITCQSGQVDCSTFWSSATNTIGTDNITDLHRPTDSWWVVLVQFVVVVALLYRVWRYNDVVSLRADREAHDRAERTKRRA